MAKLTTTERARLAGLASADKLTPEQRQQRASKAGQAALEKLGKSHFYRMNLIRHGKLQAKTKGGDGASTDSPSA